MAIKASDWGPPKQPVRAPSVAERVNVPDREETAPVRRQVCYTQEPHPNRFRQPDRQVMPLVYPDRWGTERQWHVEEWLANLAMAMSAAVCADPRPTVVCIDLAGTPRLRGLALAVCLEPGLEGVADNGERYSLRPDIMVEVLAKGRTVWWPQGLVLFDVAQ